MQARLVRARTQQGQGPLGAMDFPAAAVGIEEKMHQSPGSQQPRQGPQPLLWFAQVVQHPHRIDVVKGALTGQVEQAALLDAQLLHLGGGAGAASALPGHLQSPGADIHRKHRRAWVEVTEVIGADTGAAAGIQNSPAAGAAAGPGGQAAGGCCPGTVNAPAPVVTGRWPVLKGVARVGEAVVEGAHHRRGGITDGHGGIGGYMPSFSRPPTPRLRSSGCKHLFKAGLGPMGQP